MKYLIILFAALISTTPSIASNDSLFLNHETLYVFSFSGINLRAEASTDAYVVSKLKHGTPVSLLSISAVKEEIENRQSRWVKVEVKGKTGYLFAGFLSAYEPPVLDNRDFICNSSSNYTGWLTNITENNPIVHSEYEVQHHDSTNENCEDYLKMVYADGSEFQEFNNHNMQTITLLSSDITYNDVLNFMDYMDACREKRCNATESYQRSWVVPLRNDNGEIRSLKSHYPHDLSAETIDDRIFLKMNLSI